MTLAPRMLLVAASLIVGAASFGKVGAAHQAWFYRDDTTQRWCSVFTEAGARAASNNERFSGPETGWLRYHDAAIDSIMIMTQSEDAYQEDIYTFDSDLRVKQLVRKGHYQTDPFLTVTFERDAHKGLMMTPQSKRKVKSWRYETYFQDWPLYASLQKMPFALLIRTKPRVAVTGNCLSH